MEKLVFPANSMFISNIIIEISNFDLVEIDEVYDFPETEPFNQGFENCKIESNYFLSNMGF